MAGGTSTRRADVMRVGASGKLLEVLGGQRRASLRVRAGGAAGGWLQIARTDPPR